MEIKLFNSLSLFKQSLSRFFKYSLNIETSLISSLNSDIQEDFDLLFVFNDPIELDECCKWIYHIKVNPSKLRIIGFNSDNDINLLDIESLTNQIEYSIKLDNGKNLINISFFRNLITLFFKGHGEKSLFKALSDTRYYFFNYNNLVKSGDFTSEELHHGFLLKGVESWKIFVQRVGKYAPIIYVLGWTKSIDSLERLIQEVSADLQNIETSESFINFESKLLVHINEIIGIIEDLAQKSNYK